jgi:GrpB-like predicted nucleotidyltransferase (UPF0157 family)
MNTVVLVPHDPAWHQAFEREACAIRHALNDVPIVLHHIGSTSIPGILAKPIIDLLGIVDDLDALDRHSPQMRDLGYEVMGPFGIEGRRYFRKFDTRGQRTHHLHVFSAGSIHIERHIAFRDYLRGNPVRTAEYSALREKITSGSAVSWGDYIDAKDPFVAETEKLAVDWYRKNVADLSVG